MKCMFPVENFLVIKMHSSAYESAVTVGVGGGGSSCCCSSSSNNGGTSVSNVTSGVDDRGGVGGKICGETSSPLTNSAEILVAITTLVTEGRIPDKVNTNFRGYSEGPHCHKSKSSINHICNTDQFLCSRYEKIQSHVLSLWQKSIPICIEVLLTADCECGKLLANHLDISSSSSPLNSNNSSNNGSNQQQSTLAQSNLTSCPTTTTSSSTTIQTEQLLLEQWYLTVDQRRSKDTIPSITTQQLLNAVRSQLHFSQLAAWLSRLPDNNQSSSTTPTQLSKSHNSHRNIIYRLTIPGETFNKQSKLSTSSNYNEHNFPVTEIGNNNYLKVAMRTLPRLESIPKLNCTNCTTVENLETTTSVEQPSTSLSCCNSDQKPPLLDDRMHFSCTKHGKHKCTYDEDDTDLDLDNRLKEIELKHKSKVRCLHSNKVEDPVYPFLPSPSCSTSSPTSTDLLCRRDYESFIQNQQPSSRISTINYFTVPSTSKCVLKNINNNNYDQKSEINCCDTFGRKSSSSLSGYYHENFYNLSENKRKFFQNLFKPDEDEDSSGGGDECSSQNDLKMQQSSSQSKSDILLNAIMRCSSQKNNDENNIDDKAMTILQDDNKPDQEDDCCLNNYKKCERGDDHVDDDTVCDKFLDDDVNKCDKMHDNILSDNNNIYIKNKLYSYTNNVKASNNKKNEFIFNNNCDSIFSSVDDNDSNNIIKNHKKHKSRGTIRVQSPIKKRLEIDCCRNQKLIPPKNDNNISTTPNKQLRDRTNNLTRIMILHENRKDLFKNHSALEIKRKIDFTEQNSNDEDQNKRQTLLNSNCSTSYLDDDEVLLLDKECEKITSTTQGTEIPSVLDQKNFRKSLDNAASMVFHSRTGLPLTSSPAPIRKGAKCFDFDSKLNSVSAIRSVLFELANSNSNGDDDSESDCSAVSPCSPDANLTFPKNARLQSKCVYASSRSGLLGTFEESVLHGRLEPVSTVQGFTAELGASGLFCPNHKTFPVTVFFYSLGDMDRMSVPYLGHINLGKKGYNVPKSGLVQITLFNPMGTVVKMFVISYDLSDMPANSQTFIRQRTLYLPQNCPELQRPDLEYSDKWGQKYLRFLIHLRFMSSKSGRIYLHTDIRMIIFNKSDMDTATGLTEPGHEMRSFIYCPNNPKYSPRK
ncbi:protein FAM214A [Chrysoperla carnea]|uniref:protein FAM214A n=1 Tax=Chrysoperla carnea TaxID=189513 RepID=UPI001D062A80|nr:protein FAM214A [Chrysoperla carnea]